MNMCCKIFSTIRVLQITAMMIFGSIVVSNAQKVAGPLLVEPGVAPGYTLFAPLNYNTTYLIDNCGRVMNKWQSEHFPGNTAYLLPNGNLIRTTRLENDVITGGGGGGGVEMFNWDGELLWTFELNNDSLRLHHDIAALPDGNILMIVWHLVDKEELIAAGRNPALIPASEVLWSEKIIEVKPIPPASYEIVWEWSLWDHLVQDHDDTKANYGSVSEHPELVNVNFISQNIADWIHANAIDYYDDLNQIVFSSPFLNEFWIIDHSTTTAQAASHLGGLANKGGDLLYRWGNPAAYQRGSAADKRLGGQHHVHWIKEGERKGQVMLFNNNKGVNYSSVEFIDPPRTGTYNYTLGAGAFGPTEATYVYTESPPEQLFSNIMAGAELLPNGNLLICTSRQGFFYEVTPAKQKVWHYKSPVTVAGIIGRDLEASGPDYNNDLNFRVTKYPEDYAAFNRPLEMGEPIEGEPWAPCALITGAEEELVSGYSAYPNPFQKTVNVRNNGSEAMFRARIFDLQGREVRTGIGAKEITFDLGDAPPGMYIIAVNGSRMKIVKAD